MSPYSNGSQVPGNWFVDPVFLGVPGVRKNEDDEALAWQAYALCAQTDPEAFFPEKCGITREAKRICEDVYKRQALRPAQLSRAERRRRRSFRVGRSSRRSKV